MVWENNNSKGQGSRYEVCTYTFLLCMGNLVRSCVHLCVCLCVCVCVCICVCVCVCVFISSVFLVLVMRPYFQNIEHIDLSLYLVFLKLFDLPSLTLSLFEIWYLYCKKISQLHVDRRDLHTLATKTDTHYLSLSPTATCNSHRDARVEFSKL